MNQYLPGIGSTGPYPLLNPLLRGGMSGYVPQSPLGLPGMQAGTTTPTPSSSTSGGGDSFGGGGGGGSTTPTTSPTHPTPPHGGPQGPPQPPGRLYDPKIRMDWSRGIGSTVSAGLGNLPPPVIGPTAPAPAPTPSPYQHLMPTRTVPVNHY